MRILIIFSFMILSAASFCQSKQVYDPKANASADIMAAVKKAKAEGKHVFLQLGGNWCGWCIKFHNLSNQNDTIRTAFEKNYIVVKVNYSEENENPALMKSFGYPQRFGFPVFVILDSEGKRIHTQNTVYLEEGNGYNTQKVVEFLENWSASALDPKKYQPSKAQN